MTLEDAWKGKTAVVCGASEGLGRDLACELARLQPAKLGLVARGEGKLQALKDELQKLAPQCDIQIFPCDLCLSAEVLKIARDAFFQDGVDLLIQAVGMSDRGQVLELSRQRLEHLVSVNVVSSLHAIQAFRDVLASREGMVTLIGSLASLFAPRFLGGYAIAKHGLAALAQQARLELADQNIGVCLVCPGPIARSDAGDRYKDLESAGQLPAEAMRPGGGAKIKGLDAKELAIDILRAASKRKKRLIRPRKAWLLQVVSAIAPGLGDRLLSRSTS